jgi:Flp pilus assembly protein TadG
MFRSQAGNFRRKAKGASLALVAAFAIVLGLVLYATFNLTYMFGGSQQVRNAVDAGALSTAQKVLTVSAKPGEIYPDVVDTSGNITLSNVNRVWGKSLLVNANVQSMTVEGQALPQAQGNGKTAFTGAEDINGQLYQQLNNTTLLSTFFNQIAAQRSINMLGSGGGMQANIKSINWPTALLDRGAESNLTFSPGQIPGDANISVTAVGSAMAGYSPIKANGNYFYFVPFRSGEMPHLVSNRIFDMNRSDKTPIANITAIPNGFSVTGNGTGPDGSLGSSAYAITNPQTHYLLAIPYGYLSIQITNTAKWFVEGKQVSESAYGTEPEEQWGVKNAKLSTGGMVNGYASLGNEFTGLSLYWTMSDIARNNPVLVQKMVQRMQEVNPTFTKNQLITLLTSQQLVPGVTRYLIYPVYSTQDNTNPNIVISPITGKLPKWLVATYTPDGSELAIPPVPPSGAGPPPPPPANRANTNWQVLIGAQKPNGHHTTLIEQNLWEPDSGLNQCLGQVRVAHTTNCYFAEN